MVTTITIPCPDKVVKARKSYSMKFKRDALNALNELVLPVIPSEPLLIRWEYLIGITSTGGRLSSKSTSYSPPRHGFPSTSREIVARSTPVQGVNSMQLRTINLFHIRVEGAGSPSQHADVA